MKSSEKSGRSDSIKGFTLIELLVVIAIIGVLSSVVMTSLNTARGKARDARRVADINQIKIALEFYYDKNGNVYPPSIQEMVNDGQMPALPKPPAGAQQTDYAYAAIGSGAICNSYHLGAALEDTNLANLSIDADAPVRTTCTGSKAADFDGEALNCSGTVAAAEDNCYDIKP
jgi:prepilin-type N-terminal cleavage/methylation domain-containing protein